MIEAFLQRMAPFGLRPVEFSVMSVIFHNPGVTSRQLCTALSLLPPNLVGLIQDLQNRELVHKRPHPHDGRAQGLHPSAKGQALMQQAEATVVALEDEQLERLTLTQRKTLMRLLQKIYL
jgi:DNA-binding MarR family transcriptional regulator